MGDAEPQSYMLNANTGGKAYSGSMVVFQYFRNNIQAGIIE